MASINIHSSKTDTGLRTAEGAEAARISPILQLRRSILANFLWEDIAYEDGKSVAERIASLVPQCKPADVLALADEARNSMNLRHAPLFLVREMARYKEFAPVVREALNRVIQRADELAEFLAIYWKDKKQPLTRQVKLGLADAFTKFNAYQLAKYNQNNAIKLRDVLFLVHAKPTNKLQEETWKALVEGKLEAPDTWEVAISAAGTDKKAKAATWDRLLRENKLGAFALIRNLRNLTEAGIDANLIRQALRNAKTDRILPFRFLAAARHATQFEPELDGLMLACARQLPKLPGETVLIIDISGSMGSSLSSKSDLNRKDAACALGALVREQCQIADIYATAGNDYKREHATDRVPARHGMALIDAIHAMNGKLGGGGIFLHQVLDYVWKERNQRMADRVIVITDEQDCDVNNKRSPLHARQLAKREYLINVSNNKHGIGYGRWTHIDGWSERVLDYIRAVEEEQ